jgi:hypothetical protein
MAGDKGGRTLREQAEGAVRRGDLLEAATYALLDMQANIWEILKLLREQAPGARCRGVPLAELGRDHKRIGEWAYEPDPRD